MIGRVVVERARAHEFAARLPAEQVRLEVLLQPEVLVAAVRLALVAHLAVLVVDVLVHLAHGAEALVLAVVVAHLLVVAAEVQNRRQLFAVRVVGVLHVVVEGAS